MRPSIKADLSYQVISEPLILKRKLKTFKPNYKSRPVSRVHTKLKNKAGTVSADFRWYRWTKSKANTILQGFQKESGLKAVLQTVTAGKPYYIVTSAAQVNQSKAQTLTSSFKEKQKINGKIQKTGALKNVYRLESGYFKDSKQASSALAQIKKQTGATGTVRRVEKTKNYIVKLNQLNDTAYGKTVAFFKKRNGATHRKRSLLHSHIK
ncbi:SPOR domain-containing protein [Bacillus sp. SL00103]